MDKVTADLEKAEARFTLKPGQVLDVPKVRAAITKAGYKPTWLTFTASGSLVERAGGWAVEVKGSRQLISLQEDERLGKLREAGGKGKPITVTLRIPPSGERAVVETFNVR